MITFKKSIFAFSIAIVFIFSWSCKKEAGEGGQASITGKVYVRQYNKTFTTKTAEYYAQGEDVYIVYGNETAVGNRVRTNYDGTYKFSFLRQGNYKVYAYSKDSTFKIPSGQFAEIKLLEIKERKEDVAVPDIIILK